MPQPFLPNKLVWAFVLYGCIWGIGGGGCGLQSQGDTGQEEGQEESDSMTGGMREPAWIQFKLAFAIKQVVFEKKKKENGSWALP